MHAAEKIVAQLRKRVAAARKSLAGGPARRKTRKVKRKVKTKAKRAAKQAARKAMGRKKGR